MNKKTWTAIGFAGMVILQWCVPIGMILQFETTLRSGYLYRLRTAPVDPYDPFRGRSVALQFEDNFFPQSPGMNVLDHQTVYVQLKEDDKGFAKIANLSLTPPASDDYLEVKSGNISDGRIYIQFPFTHYFLNEKLAPEAEKAYRESNRRETHDAYVTVRIRSGNAVIEDLYISGMPVREFLQKREETNR